MTLVEKGQKLHISSLMGKRPFDKCRICGTKAYLSFEHVPPAAAFNDSRVLHYAFKKILEADNLDELKGGRQHQRGSGAYTLCETCNNCTGAWYGDAYASFAKQAMLIALATHGRPTLHYPFNIFPLRVLKQVVTMFFSVNGDGFREAQSDLVRFVLNRESREFPADIQIFAFMTLSRRTRMAGITGILEGFGTERSTSHIFSEIAHPPLGFIMTVGNSTPPEEGFCNISGLAQFGFRDWRTSISMRLPMKTIYTAFPGDYRDRTQTFSDRIKNESFQP